MKVVIAGASGFIGTALLGPLRAAGHDVHRLVRRPPTAPDEIEWDPPTGDIDAARLAGVDAVINLAGENIAAGRWTPRRRERMLRSRVEATRTLVSAGSKLPRKPAVFISASAVGYYGDRGDDVLTETSPIGHGFLPEVCLAWETHAEGAARAGIRTVLLRFGTVLAAEGGALAKMLPLFRAGAGGRLGSGRQWMSWISLADVVAVVRLALEDPRAVGPINVVAPGAVTNAEFTAALARLLHRPALLPVPAWVLRLTLGQMADDALLASTRAAPQRLGELNFQFRHPSVEAALRAAVPQ